MRHGAPTTASSTRRHRRHGRAKQRQPPLSQLPSRRCTALASYMATSGGRWGFLRPSLASVRHAESCVLLTVRHRPPNVLLRETVPNAFEVKIVDLEWAGALDDVPVYPLNMAARSSWLPWHGTAGPGKVLKKEHDEHLLQQLFC